MLGKLIKGFGCLFLGSLFLSACGLDDSQGESNSGSNIDTEVKQSNTKESEKKVEEKEKVDKGFLNKIKFADYVGSEKDTQMSPADLEKFDEKGYITNIDEDGDAMVIVPCYDEKGNIYSNIVAGEELYSYSSDWEGTCLIFQGLPKTISENIIKFDDVEYYKGETVGTESNKELWISTDQTKNTVIDSKKHKFQINYDEKALMEAKKQVEEEIKEAESSSDEE